MERIALVDAFLNDPNRGCEIPADFANGYQLMDMISSMREHADIGFDGNGFVGATKYALISWKWWCQKSHNPASTAAFETHLAHFCEWLMQCGKNAPADVWMITEQLPFVTAKVVDQFTNDPRYKYRQNPRPRKYLNAFMLYLYYFYDLPMDQADFSGLTPDMVRRWKAEILPTLPDPRKNAAQVLEFLKFMVDKHRQQFSWECMAILEPDPTPPHKRRSIDKLPPIITVYLQTQKGVWGDGTMRLRAYQISGFIRTMTQDYGCQMTDDRIDGLTGIKLSRWYAQEVENLSPAAVNSMMTGIRPFLRWAAIAGVIDQDFSPILKMVRIPSQDELPPQERSEEKMYSRQEVKEFLSHLNKTHLQGITAWAAAATLAYTGLRSFELTSLNVGDFYDNPLQHGVIEVKRKGGKYAKVCVPEIVYQAVEEMMQMRRDLAMQRNEAIAMTDPLFVWKLPNVRMTPNQLYNWLKPVQGIYGYPVGLHVLRHTFISEMEKIAGVAVARDLANHKNLKMTNRYDHSSIEQRLAAVNALDYAAAEKSDSKTQALKDENKELRDRIAQLEAALQAFNSQKQPEPDVPDDEEDDEDDSGFDIDDVQYTAADFADPDFNLDDLDLDPDFFKLDPDADDNT